ncbi:uncharacterized protein LOC116200007 isoform X2 [Punica granatum]|uniref:Uncharacterized protein LOC116200007 isoform X2 n=1 Tax=Punica granatum TaxID=22663 RepID=A0A6P8CWW0_PUNGR|nr:uncharacterized protein LOC116200007 isoform X2 [Punica granatum]
MSSTTSRPVTVKDLAEEAKKRIVFLVICVVGLSYLMSYFDARKKAATYSSKRPVTAGPSQRKPVEAPKVIKKSDWRKKVDSPVVEDAIDHFTRHIVSEWVTDLWYSRLTPDKDGPEELVRIINDVLAEFSDRLRNINLIDLLTRDLVSLICTHLEIFRMTQARIEKQQPGQITIENRNTALRHILASENKLHPALFSAEAEHKVLQHLVDGLISFIFKPEDLQCCFFRYAARELLACAVIRPVLNLANPRFINERIEAIYISKTNAAKAALVAQELQSKTGPSRVSADHFSRFLDPTVTGVELVQLKTKTSGSDKPEADHVNRTRLSKDPLLSIDTRSSRSWGSMPANSQNGDDKGIQRHRPGGEWGEMLDLISRRKAQALAPEHFENMWTKGRNYKRKEGENRLIEQVPQNSSTMRPVSSDNSKTMPKPIEKENTVKNHPSGSNAHALECGDALSVSNSKHVDKSFPSYSETHEDDEHSPMRLEEIDSGSTSYTSSDEGTGTVTGLDSPGTKVWDGKSKRNAVSHIHHPLETIEGHYAKKTSKGQLRYQRFPNGQSGRKRSSGRKVPVWHEVERTSFLSGDGQDILNASKGYGNGEVSSDDTDDEILSRANSGAAASSSAPSASLPEYHTPTVNLSQDSLVLESFLRLRCEVLGANIVKSGSKTFAVYSLSVTDANNNSWSVKRRFRHFEELHRRLKAFPEYNLHLPPKHFLSTGLDVPVIQERCRLLDGYLKKLMQLPRISGSIEVWDFLSVDSQTYYFSNSFSIVETLSVDLDNKPSARNKTISTFAGPMVNPLSRKESFVPESRETVLQMKHSPAPDGSRLNAKENDVDGRGNDVREETSKILIDAANDPTLPTEWVPPNLSVPLLDLVDVIFQLQDGGWIRRKAFWVAKQILQLGMSDAFDDWLMEKIQLLRRGSVIASGIKRIEQILWPDGIFITKHPKRQKQPPAGSSPQTPHGQQPTEIASPRLSDEQQQFEAERRAKLVYELMIDKAPAAIVSLVGRKEYEQCAKDLYYFLQSTVCLKLLAFDLLELLLLSAFPELDYVFKHLHEEKHRFGEFRAN